jgi:hypothetical protein
MVSKSVGSQSKCPFRIMNFSFVISKETIRHVLINQAFFVSDHPSNRRSSSVTGVLTCAGCQPSIILFSNLMALCSPRMVEAFEADPYRQHLLNLELCWCSGVASCRKILQATTQESTKQQALAQLVYSIGKCS